MSTFKVSKKIRRLTIIVLMVIMICSISTTTVKALVNQTTEFYVADYANLLDSDVKNYIITTNKSLCSQTGAQVVVVTVDNLEGENIEEYATALFRKFGIGDKTKNNGVLILLALQERKCRIEVGYGLEGKLTDGKTGRIQDNYMIPYFKNNDWNNGIKNGFSAIMQEIENEYGITVGSENPTNKNDESTEFVIIAVETALGGIIGCILSFIENKKIKTIFLCIDGILLLITLVGIMHSPSMVKFWSIWVEIILGIAIIVPKRTGGGFSSGGGFYGGGDSFGGDSFGGDSFGGGSFGGGGSSGGGGSTRGF